VKVLFTKLTLGVLDGHLSVSGKEVNGAESNMTYSICRSECHIVKAEFFWPHKYVRTD